VYLRTKYRKFDQIRLISKKSGKQVLNRIFYFVVMDTILNWYADKFYHLL